ncbi:MAG: tyrosine-type recombinase/integrase [Bacteriovoracia bacterium]
MAIRSYTQNNKTFYEAHAKLLVHGKQVNRKKRGLTSIASAKREELRLKMELLKLRDVPNSFTWNEWSEICLERIRIEFRNSTLINYKSHFKRWVNPVLGEKFLEQITGADIHDLIYNKVEDLGSSSRKGILKHIKRVFAMAVEEGVLAKNPAKGVKVKVPESKKLVFNKTEIHTLLDEAKKRNHPFFNHWVLALLTGMRTGELYALQWSDIDFESGFISVNKSWNRKNGFGPTKSSLCRVVPISEELSRFLRILRKDSPSLTSPVLERNSDWEAGIQAKVLKEFCQKIGITPIRFHDLRATFITQLLLQGVPVAKVMAIVGHAELKTTMVYVRLVGNDVRGVTEELGIRLPSQESYANVVNLFKN